MISHTTTSKHPAVKPKLRQIFSRIQAMPVYVRVSFGTLLLVGGVFGILPVLGFWMIPLGLLVLSVDFPWARRGYLNIAVWLRKWRDRKKGNQ